MLHVHLCRVMMAVFEIAAFIAAVMSNFNAMFACLGLAAAWGLIWQLAKINQTLTSSVDPI